MVMMSLPSIDVPIMGQCSSIEDDFLEEIKSVLTTFLNDSQSLGWSEGKQKKGGINSFSLIV